MVEIVKDAVNLGIVGNGDWHLVEKCQLVAEVDAERQRRKQEREAARPMNQIRALLADGKERTVAEIQRATGIEYSSSVQKILTRFRSEFDRVDHPTTYKKREHSTSNQQTGQSGTQTCAPDCGNEGR